MSHRRQKAAPLRRGEIVLPAAPLGPENPLPPLVSPQELHEVENVDELPPELAAGVRYGRLASVLPYLLQDGYGRDRSPRPVPALVLENDRLVATVLPGLGGRLYSLWHKESGRELLYRNRALQPANLALRNAWFAGGVEWNLGSTGHTTLTCAPLHAAAVNGPDGEPVLRLWEWERTRDLPYQLDFWLPPSSEFLYVGVRVRNPHEHAVPAYWWSNTAVPETPDVRVIAPTDAAWRFDYTRRLAHVPYPGPDDLSYPVRHHDAADLFYDLPPRRRPWIAAVDGSGRGLVQVSTSRLVGRKLFVWGQSAGGRRWQEWLSPEREPREAGRYLEIQAGLARTQLEHLPLPAGADWHWLEAYGPIDTDPAEVHSGRWDVAWRAVDRRLETVLPAAELDRAHAAWLAVADAAPGERLFDGSGWGALELARAGRAGTPPALPGTPFPPSSMGPEQRRWLALLDGAVPDADPLTPPGGTLVSAPWRDALERAADASWLTAYHLGVARWHAGDRAGAVRAWRWSLDARPSPWALRNLAVASTVDGDDAHAAGHLLSAVDLLPGCLPLVLETATSLLAAGRPADAVRLLDRHPDHGRCQLLRVQAMLALGDRAAARAGFDAGFEVADLREGEDTMTALWHAVTPGRPLPPRYDFRLYAPSSPSAAVRPGRGGRRPR